MRIKNFSSNSVRETEEYAASFAKALKRGDVIAFRGGLGAGKTAFTRGLAKGLGLDPDEVASPTFALLNIYGDRLYHYDMYRVTGYESLLSTGFFDFMDEGVSAVEWSENIAEELPENAVTVTIDSTGENTRRITVEYPGA